MQHVSITYGRAARKWQVLLDGAQCRRVAFSGSKLAAIERAAKLGQDLAQPVFLFDKEGRQAIKLD